MNIFSKLFVGLLIIGSGALYAQDAPQHHVLGSPQAMFGSEYLITLEYAAHGQINTYADLYNELSLMQKASLWGRYYGTRGLSYAPGVLNSVRNNIDLKVVLAAGVAVGCISYWFMYGRD